MSWISEKKIPVSVVPWLLIALCVVFAGVWFRYAKSRPTTDPTTPATQAQEAKKTANLPTQTVHTVIKYVDKVEVEKRIPGAVSAETLRDPNKLVTPPAQLEPWEGRRVVTPVIDNTTGDVHVEDKKLPPPWFQWKKEFYADGRYLFVGDHIGELDVGAVPIRLNAKDGGAYLEPSFFVGADVRREDSVIGARVGVGVRVRF